MLLALPQVVPYILDIFPSVLLVATVQNGQNIAVPAETDPIVGTKVSLETEDSSLTAPKANVGG